MSEIPDRDGVYDPADDVDSRGPVRFEWPEVDPVNRDLSREEWGVYGEGPPELWDQFVSMLNDGRIGQLDAELKPDAPEGWGEARLPHVRIRQKARGKHLFAHVGATPETMLRVEGVVGETAYGTPREEFVGELDAKVRDYADRFEAGDRPGRFFAFVDRDGQLQGPQEGRHRAGAAMLAGIEWVPVVVLFEAEGTFQRPTSYNSYEYGEDYLKDYPEGSP